MYYTKERTPEMEVNDTKLEKRFTLRLDANVYERVRLKALENKRSTAKQIEYMLEQSLLRK